MSETAMVTHRVGGRLRIKVPDRKGEDLFFANLENALSKAPNVSLVQSNPLTGGILIKGTGDLLAEVEQLGLESGLFSLNTQQLEKIQEEPRGLAAITEKSFQQANKQLQSFTQGSVDLSSLVIFLFVVLGIRQFVRGQALGPGIGILWYAFEMLHFLQEKKEDK